MARYSWILHPNSTVQTYYETWSGLIGIDYANKQRRVLVQTMIATLVMAIGCVIAFGLAIGFGIAENSLRAALVAMTAGAVVVVVGYGLLQLALLKRNTLLAEKEGIVLRIDPKRTEAEARLLVTQPNLTKQWLGLHPNAFADSADDSPL